MTTDTKSRILDTALALFNERGSAGVTTNHVAEALSISPGNLYYHYRNKAEIIRALFARIMAEWTTNYALPPGVLPDPEILARMLRGNFDAGFLNTLHLVRSFAAAGVIDHPGSDTAIDDIAQLLWLVGDLWLVFKDIGGAPLSPDDMDQGVRLFWRIINQPTERTIK
jgi:AcrR family transcriptional regulator